MAETERLEELFNGSFERRAYGIDRPRMSP